ncbi:ABC transporter permease [Lactobacillus sp. ESL0680]|uniref:ABC transporter permease n=1 Tax=Lactobacillus sp. ESL0680 TaxID=2983210 RepID=UPI0023F7EDBF|nr:ABC transporter permease [Lactobacillus sp. ESL0680]WEV38930.1 ABC transporter permease [Lactobacillus sp. ESL0680]
MIKAVKEEIYKFNHQKTPLYGLLTLILLMIYSAVTSNISVINLTSAFGAIEWVPIIIIAVGSAFFSMEYSNHTILLLLAKNRKKSQIYLAKFMVILLYGLALTIFSVIMTFLLNFILKDQKYHWLMIINGKTILMGLGLNILGMLIYLFFVISMSFMLIMLVKNNAVVICIGLFWGFFGASLSTALMKTFSAIISILKWNPLNMIFISQQLSKPVYSKVSQLSSLQLILGITGYSLLFAILGYLLFRQRRA